MARTAQTVLAVDISDAAGVYVGIIAAAQYAPVLLLSASIGAWADRVSKAALLIGGQLVMVASALGLAALLVWADTPHPWVVVLLTLLFGVGAAIDGPLRTAVVPALVPWERVPGAVSFNVILLQIGRVVGPVLAGALIAWSGYPSSFALAALLLTAFVAVLPPLVKISSPSSPVAGAPVSEGIRYVLANWRLLTVFALVGVGGIVGPNLTPLSALFVRAEFAGGPAEIGVAATALAIGALAGAVLAARVRTRTVGQLVLVTAFMGLSAAGTAAAPDLWTYLVLVAVAGGIALAMVSIGTALAQTMITGPLRGRVTALFFIVLVGGAPVGAPILGLLADLWGIRAAHVLGGLFIAGVAGSLGVLVRAKSRREKADG